MIRQISITYVQNLINLDSICRYLCISKKKLLQVLRNRHHTKIDLSH
ncbi:hypothetical protein [Escherichia phage vB_EcoS_ULIM2]|nr:hypothetical protein [Escherichia phage vB_EcoS_ULIM2]